MTAPRAKQPPPEGAHAGQRHRSSWQWRLPWWHDKHEELSRPGADPAYERSDAAEQERVIIEALGDLREMDVREVMTPRLDVIALSIPVSAENVAKAVRESGHSCYPVVNDGLDDVVGVLYVNDLFRSRRATRAELFSTSASPTARGVAPLSTVEISRRVRQPYVVPESRPILAALVEMRRHRRSFAIVVDEHGGLAGVFTVKDLLEPIVGDLSDELDEEEPPSILRVDGSRWLVDGQTNVDEVRERLLIDVPDGEYVTIGGYVLDVLGHIPVVSESTRLDNWELTVQEMDKRRIATVLVRQLDDDSEVTPFEVESPGAHGSSSPRAEGTANGDRGSAGGANGRDNQARLE